MAILLKLDTSSTQAPLSTWDPKTASCKEVNADSDKLSMTVTFSSNFGNLLLALLGLWVNKSRGDFWVYVFAQVRMNNSD